MSDAALNILIAAKADTSGFDQADDKLGKLTKTTGLAKAAFAAFGGVVASSAVGLLADAARAAAEDEANVIKLKQAVENSGASWDANSAAIEERIKAGQNLAFGDSDVRDSLSLLVAQTGSVEEALNRQTLAMDLARGTGMSLEQASKLLGKVTDENVNVLAKYGINVAKGSDATALFGAVQQKFGGQAEAYGQTTAASIFRVKDSIDEWKESLGATLGPAQGVVALLPGLQSGMSLAGGAVGALSSVVKISLIPSLVAMALPFAPLLIAIAAIGAAVLLLKLAWDNDWGGIRERVQGVLDFITGIFHIFETEGLGGLLKAAAELAISLPGKFVEMGQGIVRGILEGLGELKTAVWNALVSAFSAIDFWVGPFHVTSSGISVQMPNLQFPNLNPFDQHAHGGMADYTGLHWLERGERVLNRDQQRALAGGGGVARAMVQQPIQLVVSGRVLAEVVSDIWVDDARGAGGEL